MSEFVFKPFEEMTEQDYAAVGFKSGLEIHQQLFTEKKLFCRCPAGRYSEKYNAEILRHMRPTLSELGEYDGTALMEFKTKKDIVYRINHETVCTYEMDDTPPFELNDEALDIALGIAMMYGCSMVDEIHIARKQYLDGSIPTGFQRTTIVGVDGSIPYKNREIHIVQLGLEEDACREVSDNGHLRTYITDRLGMPLIETVTAPEMRTPHEVAEVGDILRRIVRSTGKVRTGIGAARQDVNVSVTGGTRVEIKGVPRIPNIPLLTYNEAMRQWNLLRLREELHKRGITPETFSSKTVDITKHIRKTSFQPIRQAIAEGMIVNCVLLRGYKGLLRWETQTDTYFSKEISDRVRVIACLTTLPNIIQSDNMSEKLASSEWRLIKKVVGATDDDTFVIVWGHHDDAVTGANEIIIRAREATIGIPSETRQAYFDGTNGFERILPGPDRMYPDTDLPPKRITLERKDQIKKTLPPPFWIREQWYHELKIPTDTIRPLSISKYASLFEFLVKEWKINPTLAAVALVHYPKRLKKHGRMISMLNEEIMKDIFTAYKENLISKEGILLAMNLSITDGRLMKENIAPVCTEKELNKIVQKTGRTFSQIAISYPEKKKEFFTGLVMKEVRGRIDGAIVSKQVNAFLEGKN